MAHYGSRVVANQQQIPNSLGLEEKPVIGNPLIRKLTAGLLAAALLYSAASIYMENGYGGIQADVALLKYFLGIDTTGGILQEHVESYLKDRVSSISVSILLAIASLCVMAKAFVKGKSTD